MKNITTTLRRNFGRLVIILLFIVFVAITVNSLMTPIPPYTDDSLIFLRYARNIVNGHGFVWNIDTPPVEGYSSFLFLMILVICFKLGLTSISVAGFIGIACAVITLAEFYFLLQQVNRIYPWLNWLSVAVLAFSPHFLYWATSGMDEPLFAAGLLFCVIVSLKYLEHKSSSLTIGVAYSILTLIRPEGMGYFLFFLCFLILCELINHKSFPIRNLLTCGIGFLLIYLPYFIWRIIYFGSFFPNTYFDKTGGGFYQLEGGWTYTIQSIGNFFNYTFLFLMGIAILLFICQIIKNKLTTDSEKILLVLGFILSCLVFTIWEGGDHFGHTRFLLPVFPLFVIFTTSVMIISLMPLKNRWMIAALTGVVFLSLFVPWRSDVIYQWERNDLAYFYKTQIKHKKGITYMRDSGVSSFLQMSQALNSVSKENQSIAAVPIGVLGYYTNLKVYDMLGLVDPVIAEEPFDVNYIRTWRPGHDKGDGNYILSLKPDYIEMNDSLTAQPEPIPDDFMMQYKSIVEIWDNADFHRRYVFYPLVASSGEYYNLYKRISP